MHRLHDLRPWFRNCPFSRVLNRLPLFLSVHRRWLGCYWDACCLFFFWFFRTCFRLWSYCTIGTRLIFLRSTCWFWVYFQFPLSIRRKGCRKRSFLGNSYMERSTGATHAGFGKLILYGQKKDLSGLSIVDSPHLGLPLFYDSLAFDKPFEFHAGYELIVLLIFELDDSDRAESFVILESFFWVFGLLISHVYKSL